MNIDQAGMTPLVSAVNKGHLEMVKLLIQAGANDVSSYPCDSMLV